MDATIFDNMKLRLAFQLMVLRDQAAETSEYNLDNKRTRCKAAEYRLFEMMMLRVLIQLSRYFSTTI